MNRNVSCSQPVSRSPLRTGRLLLRAPAKINWFLQIVGRRPDGFHDIASLMQCVSLYDEISLAHSDSLAVETNMKIPTRENIVYKAASLLRDRVSYRKGVHITLRKKIPAGSGLGGGSSDAACVLSGLNRLWGLRLSRSELIQIGAEAGSDIPFFLGGPVAFVRGKGERLRRVRLTSSAVLLIVKPRISGRWPNVCLRPWAAPASRRS